MVLTARRVIGFLTAGGMATILHWVSMSVLMAFGLSAVAATFLGSVIGAVSNYTLQRSLAFPDARPHGEAVWRYVLSTAVASVCNTLVFFALHNLAQIPVVASQLVTTATVAALNYYAYNKMVFHDQNR
jgi:putative flippase GtrA